MGSSVSVQKIIPEIKQTSKRSCSCGGNDPNCHRIGSPNYAEHWDDFMVSKHNTSKFKNIGNSKISPLLNK